MNRFGMAAGILVVTLLAATCMVALYAVVGAPVGMRPRMLMINGGSGEYAQRTLAGARAAARELGVDLQVETVIPGNLVQQQLAIVRKINPADYAGVAISPADPESQLDLINDLAGRTKLVTIGRECQKSRRLCHIGFCAANDGGLAARLVRDQLSRQGKIVLLSTKSADAAATATVSDRLAGFKEQWAVEQDASTPSPLLEVTIQSNQLVRASHDLSLTLADSALAFIVALDTKAAETALKALATPSGTRSLPIIAFDPSTAIFDAIADGRVCSAIYNDPYRNGFAAIKRLGILSHAGADTLPVPGRGTDFLVSEVVRKENLADFRQRTRS